MEEHPCTVLTRHKNCRVNGKVKIQGPYETLPQAVAARNAIIHFLNTSGHSVLSETSAIWALAAQGGIRGARLTRDQSWVDTPFKPEDFFLDW